jgi:hypothetical protein
VFALAPYTVPKLFRWTGAGWDSVGLTLPRDSVVKSVRFVGTPSGDLVVGAAVMGDWYNGRPFLRRLSGGTWADVPLPACDAGLCTAEPLAAGSGGMVAVRFRRWYGVTILSTRLLWVNGASFSEVALPAGLGIDWNMAVSPDGRIYIVSYYPHCRLYWSEGSQWRTHNFGPEWDLQGIPFADSDGSVLVAATAGSQNVLLRLLAP